MSIATLKRKTMKGGNPPFESTGYICLQMMLDDIVVFGVSIIIYNFINIIIFLLY